MSDIKPIIKAVDDEHKISVEMVYAPYELDSDEQWMRPETIRKACSNFNENLEKGNVKGNMYHSRDDDGAYTSTDLFEITKSWINEVPSVIGEQDVPEGAWLCQLQWKDEAAWESRKKGILKGVSIGAMGKVYDPNDKGENDG